MPWFLLYARATFCQLLKHAITTDKETLKDNNQKWHNHFSSEIIRRGMFDMWWPKQVFNFRMLTFKSSWWDNEFYIGSVQQGKERQDDCTILKKWCKKPENCLGICMYSKNLCPLFFIKFLFFHQMIALKNLWKMFFISSKELFSFSRCLNFCVFFPSFPHFADSKGKMELE